MKTFGILMLGILAIYTPLFIWDVVSNTLFYQELVAGSTICTCTYAVDICLDYNITIDDQRYHTGNKDWLLKAFLTTVYVIYLISVIVTTVKTAFPKTWEELKV